MQRHPTEPTVVFLELQFLPARPAQKYVIDITRLLANEERGFLFLLALGHFVRTYLQQKLRSWTFRNAYYGKPPDFWLVQLGYLRSWVLEQKGSGSHRRQALCLKLPNNPT